MVNVSNKKTTKKNTVFSREKIGNRIREIRKPLVYKEFAKKLGVSEGFVCEIEKGVKKPSAEMLFAIAKKYGYSINWILTGYGPKYISSIADEKKEEWEFIPDKTGSTKLLAKADTPELTQLIEQFWQAYLASDDFTQEKILGLLVSFDPGE
jgi:transcriptional regulator with XRE-family HTH domain